MKEDLETKLTKAIKKNLKAKKGFVLIYNGDTMKMESAFSEMCNHEIANVLGEFFLDDEEEEEPRYAPSPLLRTKRHIC